MRGGLFSKRSVKQVTTRLGEDRYSLEDPGHGPLRASFTHVVRGIALKTEEIPVTEWIARLGETLSEQARAAAAVHEALSRLIP